MRNKATCESEEAIS